MKKLRLVEKSRVRIATRVQKNTLKIHVIVRKSIDMRMSIIQEEKVMTQLSK